MSTTRYTVYAYSPTLNQQVRRFDLTELDNYTQEQAEQHAYFFAQLQNTNQYMNTQDWQPQVVLEAHGIDTLPGYIG